jgi:hypothetical protein
MEQHIFKLLLIIEETTEMASQFVILMSIVLFDKQKCIFEDPGKVKRTNNILI